MHVHAVAGGNKQRRQPGAHTGSTLALDGCTMRIGGMERIKFDRPEDEEGQLIKEEGLC